MASAADLNDFYYPTTIRSRRGDSTPKTISSLSELGANKALIEGVAGRGKSLFMRFLAVSELEYEKSIPVFIELRRLNRSDLIGAIVAEMKNYGCSVDSQNLESLFKFGAVSLFLDGFDELSADDRPIVADQIDELAHQHKDLKILVASRPFSVVGISPLFKTLEIPLMAEDEYEEVLKRTASASDSTMITNKVRSAPVRIRQVLSTPLMVELLLLRFHHDNALPQDIVEFYSGIIPILVNLHPSSKSHGHELRTRSGLGPVDLEKVFQCVCFQSKKEFGDFTLGNLHEWIAPAIKWAEISQADIRVSDVGTDLIEGTNLILEEGAGCNFIHKSIQEFFSAQFMSKLPDDKRQRIVTALAGRWQDWEEELWFLGQEKLDPEGHWRSMFILPDILNALNCSTLPDSWRTRDEDVRRLAGVSFLGKYGITSTGDWTVQDKGHSHRWSLRQTRPIEQLINELLQTREIVTLARDNRVPLRSRQLPSGMTMAYWTVRELLEYPKIRKCFFALADRLYENLYNQAKKIETQIRQKWRSGLDAGGVPVTV